jgi:hypothetical protein
MKYILPAVLTFVGVANCQNAIIYHPKNRETKIGEGFKCYEKSSGIAKGVRTKPSIEVQFFKNDKCEGEWFRVAWGRHNFTDSFKYYSVKLEKHKKKKEKEVKSENADADTEDSGSEESEVTDDSETSVKSTDESGAEADKDDSTSESEETK